MLGSRYGPGNGTIWLDNVNCSGLVAASISDCHHNGWGVHNCDHSSDVSVLCGAFHEQYGNGINNHFIKSERLHNV